MTAVSDQVGKNVRMLRKTRGWSVDDLRVKCGESGLDLSPTALYLIEGGGEGRGTRSRRRVTVDELVPLAAALGVAPGLLLRNELHVAVTVEPMASCGPDCPDSADIGRGEVHL